MIRSDIRQFQRCSAQCDRPLPVDGFVRDHGMRLVENLQPLLCFRVGDNACPGLFEGLTAGDVIEMVVTGDQVADGSVGDLADLLLSSIGCRLAGGCPLQVSCDDLTV